jgi:hypothetical protein
MTRRIRISITVHHSTTEQTPHRLPLLSAPEPCGRPVEFKVPDLGLGSEARRGRGYSRVRPFSPTMGSAWPGMRDITAINLAAVCVVWYEVLCGVVWCGGCGVDGA